MKRLIYFFALIIGSCNSEHYEKTEQRESKLPPVDNSQNTVSSGVRVAYWMGNLNKNVPIFIRYQIDSNIIVGEITYLNTQEKSAIKLIGTIEEGGNCRLLEFDRSGNITGVIVGKPAEEIFNGIWVSPQTDKELEMRLFHKDTSVTESSIKATSTDVFGKYFYQYGKKGYTGNFEFQKISGDEASLYIFSTTNVERGPNIAEVVKDTITYNSGSFIYKIPESDSCEFRVKFYKSFAYIEYTRGYCAGQFGLNATIDGIFLKTD